MCVEVQCGAIDVMWCMPPTTRSIEEKVETKLETKAETKG